MTVRAPGWGEDLRPVVGGHGGVRFEGGGGRRGVLGGGGVGGRRGFLGGSGIGGQGCRGRRRRRRRVGQAGQRVSGDGWRRRRRTGTRDAVVGASETLLELGHQLEHRPLPFLRTLGQRPYQRRVDGGGKLAADQLGCARRRLGQVRHDHRCVALAAERNATGQALEHQRAERVDVGRGQRRLPLDLLRRGVVERPHESAGAGHIRVVVPAREAEVGQVAVIVCADEHVVRLDVAVHEAVFVGDVECGGDGGEQRHRAGRRQLAGADQLLQVGAAHELHGDV